MLRIARIGVIGAALLAFWAALLQQTTEEPAHTWLLLVRRAGSGEGAFKRQRRWPHP